MIRIYTTGNWIFPDRNTKANAAEKVTNLKLHLQLCLFLGKVIFLARIICHHDPCDVQLELINYGLKYTYKLVLEKYNEYASTDPHFSLKNQGI